MSQENNASQLLDIKQAKLNENDFYTIPVSFSYLNYNKGVPTEVKVKDKPMKFAHISSLNVTHSEFIMDMMEQTKSNRELAVQFVETFCADPTYKESLLSNRLACYFLFNRQEVGDEIEGFLKGLADIIGPSVADQSKTDSKE